MPGGLFTLTSTRRYFASLFRFVGEYARTYWLRNSIPILTATLGKSLGSDALNARPPVCSASSESKRGPWFLLHRPPRPSAELTQKRLTFNSSENPVGQAAISPDGNYHAYSDPAGIHVKLLSTSEERLIPRPAGVPAGAVWLVASWFPDGTQLLANAWEMGGHKSMWTVSVLGQSPRELREGAVGWMA